MSPENYSVLEPVHVLLERATNDFVVRKIAREVGRQLREGTVTDRLHHRLTGRLAKVMISDIRDPGRWLLGVALPRWGCGYQDCEAGIIWRTGAACELCAETVEDRFAARQREQRLEQGLCPQHGTRPGPSGRCADCELDAAVRRPARVPAPQEPEGPPRSSCRMRMRMRDFPDRPGRRHRPVQALPRGGRRLGRRHTCCALLAGNVLRP
ncbi:hypothetical protein ACFXGI_38790 [Streptomyces sp. NPDC059355]|uniref:hypothetical protein n=1 Tax=Streptomyces sp. NPDC059355 TaxID=3346811 RepID=UPI003673A05F